MIFWTSFWCTFSHENGSTAGCILACYMKTEKNIRNIILWFLGFADWFDGQTWRKNQFKRSLSVKTLLHGHKAMGVHAHSGSYRALVTCKIITGKLLFTIFILILLTSPDNEVSDTTRKIMYMHIQAETPQQQAPILLRALRERESSLFLQICFDYFEGFIQPHSQALSLAP